MEMLLHGAATQSRQCSAWTAARVRQPPADPAYDPPEDGRCQVTYPRQGSGHPADRACGEIQGQGSGPTGFAFSRVQHILATASDRFGNSAFGTPYRTASHRAAPHRTAHRTAPHRTAQHHTAAPHCTVPPVCGRARARMRGSQGSRSVARGLMLA